MMKARFQWAVLFFAMVLGSSAFASSGKSLGGGGHTVPSPLMADANTKVELAEGEVYTVAGKVLIVHGQPLLQIDLGKMPWLASAARIANPYYVLEGAPSFWKTYEGDTVKYTCEAHGSVLDVQGDLKYVITLGAIDGGKYQVVRDCPIRAHHCAPSDVR